MPPEHRVPWPVPLRGKNVVVEAVAAGQHEEGEALADLHAVGGLRGVEVAAQDQVGDRSAGDPGVDAGVDAQARLAGVHGEGADLGRGAGGEQEVAAGRAAEAVLAVVEPV